MFLSLREETLLTTLFTHYAPLAPMLLAPLWVTVGCDLQIQISRTPNAGR